jgi:hypothetical protein
VSIKTGRNDPCPCGSGKKFKHCCLGNGHSSEGPARNRTQGIADEIAEIAAEQSLSSLEELNSVAATVMNQRNSSALVEFCGLSPEQMASLLYAPFDSPQVIKYSTDIELMPDIRIIWLFTALVEAIGEKGLKATARGNLPLKFCKALAQQIRQHFPDPNSFYIGGIRSETDFSELYCTRLVAELAGLIRKYRGHFVLTKKCRDMLARQQMGGIYMELFTAYTTKFNWGYRDGYPEAEIVQHSFLYTLFLLTSFGGEQRAQRFYENKFLTAFPMALEMFPETDYSSAEDSARHCYILRSIDRFTGFFGLVELTSESQKRIDPSYTIRKSALLDQFVTFIY